MGATSSFVLSPDGTKLAFVTSADDLGPTDTNDCSDLLPHSCPDIYLRDLVAGTTTLVSVNGAGTDSAAGRGTGGPSFSPDGTKLVFSTDAGDLGPADTNGLGDVYVRDLAAGTTELVSIDAAGTGASNGFGSFGGTFGPVGEVVVFESYATNLGPTDTDDFVDVYLRDLTTGQVRPVSTNAAGTDTDNGNGAFLAAFSPDGTQIAFHTAGDDLGPRDTNRDTDLYVHDLATGRNTLVSGNHAGTDSGAGPSAGGASFSPDGGRIVFGSSANDLVPGDTNTYDDAFVRDLTTRATTLVSAAATGSGPGDLTSYGPVFSPDGTGVAFGSLATDLVPGDDNERSDVFLRHLATGVTTLVSTNATRQGGGNGHSDSPAFTPAGALAFKSAASDLGAVDTNGADDVYLATFQGADSSTRLTASVAGNPSDWAVTYELDLANAGPRPAADVRALLLIPEETTAVTIADDGGSCHPPSPTAPRLVICDLGSLAPGDTRHATITAAVTAPSGTTLDATAALISPTYDPIPSDNRLVLTTPVP